MELGDWLEVVCDFDSRKAHGGRDDEWMVEIEIGVLSCGWLDLFFLCLEGVMYILLVQKSPRPTTVWMFI